MSDSVEAILLRKLPPLYRCEPIDGYTRVRTPLLYPDGDVVDVFVKSHDSFWTVTDLGESTGWLRMQSLAARRSPKQTKLIEDVCLNHGLEFFKGMLNARANSSQDLAAVVTRVAQGALRVGDIWFTMRTRSTETVTDEVESLLSERNVAFQRNQKLVGRSGLLWYPDFHTRGPQRSSLIYVLSTGSRAAARGVAEHVFTAWSDLSALQVGPEALQFISLFDDTMDTWNEENFKLLQSISTVSRWSRPDELMEVIAA